MRRSNDAWIVGDVAYIDVATPKFPHAVALIDAADWELVFAGVGTRSRWHARQGHTGQPVYVCRHVGRGAGALVKLHRWLLGLTDPASIVDHANRDGLDNRRANLRPADKRQNGMNSAGCGQAGYKGVRRNHQSRNFGARICVDGAETHIGSFPTAEEAARAYDRAASAAHGEFAFLNFPGEVAR